MAVLRFFPLQYNPATQQVRFHRRVIAEVVWERTGAAALPAAGERAGSEFERMAHKIIANPQDATGVSAQTAVALHDELTQWSGVWGRIGIDADAIYGIDCTDLGHAGFDIATLPLDTSLQRRRSNQILGTGNAHKICRHGLSLAQAGRCTGQADGGTRCNNRCTTGCCNHADCAS
ncbi:MAG: hypothetical protein IPK16_05380 [Anaerolineales bacterium]|nr:hypothetical protein [Anaerolineales bacterium]